MNVSVRFLSNGHSKVLDCHITEEPTVAFDRREVWSLHMGGHDIVCFPFRLSGSSKIWLLVAS